MIQFLYGKLTDGNNLHLNSLITASFTACVPLSSININPLVYNGIMEMMFKTHKQKIQMTNVHFFLCFLMEFNTTNFK